MGKFFITRFVKVNCGFSPYGTVMRTFICDENVIDSFREEGEKIEYAFDKIHYNELNAISFDLIDYNHRYRKLFEQMAKLPQVKLGGKKK